MRDILEKLREYAQYAETKSEINTFETSIKEITVLREENAQLREELKLLVSKEPVQLTCEGRAFIKAIIVSESELTAARDVIREGENRDD